jgi:hypothetical protein
MKYVSLREGDKKFVYFDSENHHHGAEAIPCGRSPTRYKRMLLFDIMVALLLALYGILKVKVFETLASLFE